VPGTGRVRLADEALYDAKRNGTVLRFVARA
jgi:hypothetical protein